MSAQLSRLQAFLAGAGELEIVTPPAAARPDYFGRFARLLGVTLAAAHVGAAAAPAPPSPAAAPAPPSPAAAAAPAMAAARDPAATRADIISVRLQSARYLAHGRSPVAMQINMVNPDAGPQIAPIAAIAPGAVCRIEGVRANYDKADPRLAVMANTEQLRAMVLIHESMHCRIGMALMGYVQRSPSKMVVEFANRFNESAADAMAILTLARVDGIASALVALDRLAAVRAAEAVSPEADGHHDSRETLKRVRSLLETAPGKLNSDSATFSLAITETMMGVAQSLTQARPASEKGYLASPQFSADMAGFHQAVEEMARDYLGGPAQLGAPQVALNELVARPGVLGAQAEQQFLAKRTPSPGFTAESLRGQAEAITASVIAAAGGRALPALAATAPAPAPQANSILAIGRLRSHLGTIYARPSLDVDAEDMEPGHQEPAEAQR